MNYSESREIPYIEAYIDNKKIGRFVNMNTANQVLNNQKNVTYKFFRINEKDKDFWTLIRKYYVMSR